MLLIFDLDDTLIHTHRVFMEITEAFLSKMAALGFADDNVYYTLDAFDREAIENAGAYVPWAFPKAMRLTYEFYCEKEFAPYDAYVADELEALGMSFREAEYHLVEGAKDLLNLAADAGHYLVLLTQGGYDEQRFKVEQHNLGAFFEEIIVVDKKSPQVLQNIMERHGFSPRQTIVIGNSPKSDIAPALAAGAHPILVKVTDSWDFEDAELSGGYAEASTLGEVWRLIEKTEVGYDAKGNNAPR